MKETDTGTDINSFIVCRCTERRKRIGNKTNGCFSGAWRACRWRPCKYCQKLLILQSFTVYFFGPTLQKNEPGQYCRALTNEYGNPISEYGNPISCIAE